MSRIRAAWLQNPWLVTLVEVALGVIFIAAALPKITDPPAFAHMIYNYRMLPGGAVNVLALVMPWIELFCGIALVLGVWRRAAALIIAAMLATFIVAIGVNLLRGHAVDCGCFDVKAAGKSREALLRDMWWVLARDVGLLLMAGISLAASRREPRRWPFRAARPVEASAS
jgi:putative oxidoreductase